MAAPSTFDFLFLGKRPDLHIAKIRSAHADAFALAEEVNRYANWKLSTLSANRWNLQHLLVAALLPRLLTAFHGCVHTAERGLVSEAILLARKILEVMFRLVAIAKSREVAEKYVRSDEARRKRVLKKLRLLESVEHSEDRLRSIEKLETELDQSIQRDGIREMDTLGYATAAGLADFYNSAYVHFSGSAHANARDLEELLQLDGDGDVETVVFGPSYKMQTDILATAIESVIISLDAATDLLGEDSSVGLRVLRRKVRGLFGGEGAET